MQRAINSEKTINLSDTLSSIINEIVTRFESFSHIDTSRILISIASNRKKSGGGIYAKLVPLRFEKGSKIVRHSGKIYTIPEIQTGKTTYLYLLHFYMPKFFDQHYKDKLKIILHELYHISPDFDGDIRRISKRKAAHGHSKSHYDSFFVDELNMLYDYILESKHFEFIKMNSERIFSEYHDVKGQRIKNPKPVEIDL